MLDTVTKDVGPRRPGVCALCPLPGDKAEMQERLDGLSAEIQDLRRQQEAARDQQFVMRETQMRVETKVDAMISSLADLKSQAAADRVAIGTALAIRKGFLAVVGVIGAGMAATIAGMGTTIIDYLQALMHKGPPAAH